MFKCHRVAAKVELCGGGFLNVTPFVPLRLSAPVRARLIALLFFFPPILPSFYLFRSLSPPATYIERSCPYMALANVWPGRHKVIVEGFSLLCSCASCTTAQTGPFKGLTKEHCWLRPFPPWTAIFLCCLCSSVKWDGTVFCLFF